MASSRTRSTACTGLAMGRKWARQSIAPQPACAGLDDMCFTWCASRREAGRTRTCYLRSPQMKRLQNRCGPPPVCEQWAETQPTYPNSILSGCITCWKRGHQTVIQCVVRLRNAPHWRFILPGPFTRRRLRPHTTRGIIQNFTSFSCRLDHSVLLRACTSKQAI